MKNAFQYIIAFVVLGLLGALLVPKLAVRLSPSGAGQSLTVQYSWAGAAPLTTESQATALLEGTFATLQCVQKISSTSGYGYGYITLQLDKNTNADALRFEVSALVRQVYPKLPKGISYPSISLNTPKQQDKDKPFIIMQLDGPESLPVLSKYANESLKPSLAQTLGVYEVTVQGSSIAEWQVLYSAQQLDNLQLSKVAIEQAIEGYFEEQKVGIFTDSKGQELYVRTLAIAQNGLSMTENLAKVPIKTGQNRIVFLKDIAQIKQIDQRPVAYYRVNGRNALTLVLRASAGANELTLAKSIRLKIKALSQTLPLGYQLKIEYDASQFIAENLRKIGIQVVSALIILLVFMIISTRSFIYVIVVSLAMVINLLISVILFYVFKIEIHLYSLAAITTSLGIIIDNMIVMIDHYRRHQNNHIFSALLGATLSTCAGLVVIWFLPEAAQLELKDFGLVMVISLGVSLLVAMVFVPALMSRWQKKPTIELPNKESLKDFSAINIYKLLIIKSLKIRWLILVALFMLFGTPFFMLPNRLEDGHWAANYYNSVFDNEVFKEDIRPSLDICLGGTLRLFVNYVYEGSYFAKPEQTALHIWASLPNNSTLEQMNAVFIQLEQSMKPFKQIDRFVTQVYSGQNASMVVYFKPPFDQSSFPYLLKNRAISISTQMSGINWNIYGVGQGFSQNTDLNATPTFSVEMQGYNYKTLENQAIVLKNALERHPRIQEVNISKNPMSYQNKPLNEYILRFDNEQLALQKLNASSLSQTLFNFGTRPNANLYVWHNSQYQGISVVPSEYANFDVFLFGHRPFKSDSSIYSFSSIAKISKESVMPEIIKEDQQYIRWLSFDYMGSQHFGEKYLNKTLDSIRKTLPIGYRAKQQQNNWFDDNPRRPYQLIGLVVILIYLICAIIFENLLQPLALIVLIPLSYIGVFLFFYWFDFNFDQGGYAAFILLAGNVVCAGIFLIAAWNVLKKENPTANKQTLYFDAFSHKFQAIWLTILSTVVGLVPFLFFENEPFWFALGLGTCGGLLMSLLVIVVALPLMLLESEY